MVISCIDKSYSYPNNEALLIIFTIFTTGQIQNRPEICTRGSASRQNVHVILAVYMADLCKFRYGFEFVFGVNRVSMALAIFWVIFSSHTLYGATPSTHTCNGVAA